MVLGIQYIRALKWKILSLLGIILLICLSAYMYMYYIASEGTVIIEPNEENYVKGILYTVCI